jgi:hypothetical protein
MPVRSSKVLEILRETIEQAEETPGLGPHDPGVVQLKEILARWVAERDAAERRQLSLSDQPETDTKQL